MCFILLSCLLVIFHSTDYLDLYKNSLTGTMPSVVGLLTKLSESIVVWLLVAMIVFSCVFYCTLMLACHIHFTAYLDLSVNSLVGTIPSEVGLLMKLSESSICLVACCNDCFMCFSFYSHTCLSLFILQLGCISTTIISRVNSRVLTLLMIVGSRVIMKQTHILKHAVPFRETWMHSRGVILYKIVYIIGLKCTIFTLFYFKLCHIVE